jgi:branched-chain amino acid transport system permease protein
VSALRTRVEGIWSDRVAGPLAKSLVAFVGVIAFTELAFGRARTTDVLGVSVPTAVPAGIILQGMIIGCLYALIAFGLILIYRANRLISFAQAGLGSVPAVLALLLLASRSWPYGVAFLIVIAGAAITGFLVEFVIMRRFSASPRLVATVATIGVAQLLALVEFYLPKWVTGQVVSPQSFRTPLSRFRWEFGGVIHQGNALVIPIVVAIVMVALTLFFRFTRLGIAVRASADNDERASLLGIPVRRVATVVWVIAAVCSGLGVFLRAPVVGLPLGGLIGPTILLYALAAAVVARMESLPVALGAGMAIGVLDQSANYVTRRGDISVSLMLPLLLIALALQRRRLSRAFDTGISTFRNLREFRPIPRELRGTPEVRWGLAALATVVAAVLLTAPYLVGTSRANFASLVIIYAIVGVSLVVLTGWAGQISLGQFAFAGLGAGIAGGLAVNHGWDFFLTLVVAGALGAAVAVLIGLPTLRLPGLFLAVVTLAFAATVNGYFLNRKYFDSVLPDANKTIARPVLWDRVDVGGDVAYYYVCLAALFIAYLSARALRRTRSGRVFISVRDNVRAAQAYGMNAARGRLAAFALSGFYAAVAGALLAYQQGSVDREAFAIGASLDVFVFAVVGGITSLPGAILGAIYYEGLRYFGPTALHLKNLDVLATGAGVLFLLLFLPGGLAEGVYRLRDRMLRGVANRRGIHVPSLVADRRVDLIADREADDVLVRAEELVEESATLGSFEESASGAT